MKIMNEEKLFLRNLNCMTIKLETPANLIDDFYFRFDQLSFKTANSIDDCIRIPVKLTVSSILSSEPHFILSNHQPKTFIVSNTSIVLKYSTPFHFDVRRKIHCKNKYLIKYEKYLLIIA